MAFLKSWLKTLKKRFRPPWAKYHVIPISKDFQKKYVRVVVDGRRVDVFFAGEAEAWVAANIKYRYRIAFSAMEIDGRVTVFLGQRVSFIDDDDALLFRLTWC